MCWHLFVDGFGCMGDGVVCVKCGLDKYPEVIPIILSLCKRFIKNDGTYAHRSEGFPHVIKFDEQITYHTDWSTYVGYFDKDGKYIQGKFKSVA